MAFVVSGSWLSGCGDDSDDGGGGKGASGGTAGNAGSGTGGSTGGSGGSPTGGSGGTPTGGNAGSGGTPTGGSGGMPTGGSAGSAGNGMGGDDGMGGDGMGGDGMGGDGMGGDDGMGGSMDAMCTTGNLSVTIVMPNMQAHDHLPIMGAARTTLLNMINTGMPLTFTLPTDGTNAHNHTLTFAPQQLTTLRNGGELMMNVTSSMGGPMGNMHTHTYALECEP